MDKKVSLVGQIGHGAAQKVAAKIPSKAKTGASVKRGNDLRQKGK